MARGVNKVILVGNLGNDPEIRYTQNQKQVANLSLATSDQWTDKMTGQRQERTEWHRVVMFDRLAEIAGQYLKKGSKVYIEGRLQTRKWQNQQGVDQYTTEIVANDMQMLDGRGGEAGQNMGGHHGQAARQTAPQQDYQGGGYAQPAYGGQPPAPQQAAPAHYQTAAPAQAPHSSQQNAPQNKSSQNFNDFDDEIPF